MYPLSARKSKVTAAHEYSLVTGTKTVRSKYFSAKIEIKRTSDSHTIKASTKAD